MIMPSTTTNTPYSTAANSPQPIWPTLRLTVPSVDAEFASGELWATGATGISEVEVGEDLVQLVAGYPSVDAAHEAAAEMDPSWKPVTVVVEGSEWMDLWREHFEPFATDSFVVMPAWQPDAPLPLDADNLLRLDIDPGRAFGSGAHPTTRLILDRLPDVLRAHTKARVLDVGCGSGILGIAAIALGASSAVGVDVDVEAIRVTRSNAQRNGVADRLAVSHDPLYLVAGRFDVVLANILAPVLRELAPVLAARTKTTGTLVLAGLIQEQVDGVLAALPEFRVVERRSSEPWVALVLRR